MVENGRWSVSYLWGTILIFGLPHISFLQSYNLQGFIKGPAQYKSNRVHPWPRFPRVPTNLSSFTFPDLHSETVRGSPFLPSGGHIYCPRYFLSEDMISRNSGQVNYFWQFRSICEGWYFKGFALNCPKSIFVSKSLMKSILPQGNFGNLKSILTCCWLIEERLRNAVVQQLDSNPGANRWYRCWPSGQRLLRTWRNLDSAGGLLARSEPETGPFCLSGCLPTYCRCPHLQSLKNVNKDVMTRIIHFEFGDPFFLNVCPQVSTFLTFWG